MASRTYSSKLVTVVFAGQQLKGYADGDFLTVSPTSERSTMVAGGDGNVQRSVSADLSGTATITLQQVSPSNAVLQQYANTQDTGSFIVQDLSGDTVISADIAWVSQQAEASFGVEAGTREWAISLGEINWGIAGNNL